jgi:hypothetical protein
MDQRNFDFCEDEPHPAYLELSQLTRNTLIELMASLIVSVKQSQEKNNHESIHTIKN